VREPEGIETPRPGKSSESGLVKTNHLHPQVWIRAILREVHAADVQFSRSVLAILIGSVGETLSVAYHECRAQPYARERAPHCKHRH